ncbi:MAG: HAD family phosphatase [Lachnospiraceae bacterium]|nr:HAD family phosphatase [Lachnospiraceae bacterium]
MPGTQYYVIFDMDGVIFDSERACLYCWQEIAADFGMPDVEDVFRRCIGTNNQQTRDIVENAYAEEFGSGIADRLMAESSRRFHAKYDNGNLPVKDGVREILTFLKDAGVTLGLASSTRKASVECELREAGFLDYFNHIVGGDAVCVSKPDPEIYEIAIRELGAVPARTWAIEDSFNGIRSAHAAQLRPIMVPDIIPADEEMRGLSEVVCADLREARDYLARQIEG